MAGIGLCDGEVVLSALGLFHCSCFTWVQAMACVVVGVVWVCVLFVVGWGVCFVFVWFLCFARAPSPPSYISYEDASHSEMGT